MKKKAIIKDLWIIVLDIIAVNLSYYLAIFIRFYRNGMYQGSGWGYVQNWVSFTPWYTVLAIAIFFLFKLYGGMWIYAGLNDMKLIIMENACTAIIHVVGTLIFIRRMPITYYILGAVIQFLAIVLIRFAYKILTVEKKKIRSRGLKAEPVLIVGTGESGRKIIKQLEDNTAWRPVVIAGTGAGQTIDGIPVVDFSTIDNATEKYKIKSIFIADPLLSVSTRNGIKDIAKGHNIDCVDYTGYLANLTGSVSLTSLLEITTGPVTLILDGMEKQFSTAEEAISSLQGRYVVKRVTGDMKIELGRDESSDEWMKDYKEVMGEDVSYF